MRLWRRVLVGLRVALILVLIHVVTRPISTAQAQSRRFGTYEWVLATSEKFDQPLYLTHAGDGSGRLFIVEQVGKIWIVQDGVLTPQPFLDISGKLPDEVFRGGYTERGLLGLAFDPQFAQNGYLYVTYSNRSKQNVLARYRVRPDAPTQVDPASEQILLRYDHPEMNHNGGMIAFGRDGYLYLSVGDGGGTQGDPNGLAQDQRSWLGKILRLGVDVAQNSASAYQIPPDNPFRSQPSALPEIWAVGLRNPWRFSFDRASGDLYIGDVGWGNHEEINFQPAGQGGQNYGWNFYEGLSLLEGKTDPGGLTPPVATYPHENGACSVTGGYVLRGPGAPSLTGVYVYGDYCVGRIWALWRDADDVWQTQVLMETGMQIASFGEDEAGRLYLVNYKGYIYRLREQ